MSSWLSDLPIMGECIMPREGVFAKVLHGGKIKAGDEMIVLAADE